MDQRVQFFFVQFQHERQRRRKTAFAVPYRLIQAHVAGDHPIDHAVLTEGGAVRQLRGCACRAAATIGGYASEPDEPG